MRAFSRNDRGEHVRHRGRKVVVVAAAWVASSCVSDEVLDAYAQQQALAFAGEDALDCGEFRHCSENHSAVTCVDAALRDGERFTARMSYCAVDSFSASNWFASDGDRTRAFVLGHVFECAASEALWQPGYFRPFLEMYDCIEAE